MSASPPDPRGVSLAAGRYVLAAKLGEGGMGCVYKARDVHLGTDVVIKVPHRTALTDAEFSRRFREEVRSLVALSHPHVVKVTDVGEWDGLPYAVMQYLPGGSLDGRAVGGSGAYEVPAWLPDVAAALDFVHARGYVHRDVKPANILFDGAGHAFLGDFGVVKVMTAAAEGRAAANPALTGTGILLGTPEYMAPELVMGESFDGRADQYALAVTVYELLCGRRPFEHPTKTRVLMMQTSDAPAAPSSVRAWLPAALDAAVLRGLAKRPADRFPTCAAFADAVADAARALPGANGEKVRVRCAGCGRGVGVAAELFVRLTRPGRRAPCPGCGAALDLAAGTATLATAPGGSGEHAQGSSLNIQVVDSGAAHPIASGSTLAAPVGRVPTVIEPAAGRRGTVIEGPARRDATLVEPVLAPEPTPHADRTLPLLLAAGLGAAALAALLLSVAAVWALNRALRRVEPVEAVAAAPAVPEPAAPTHVPAPALVPPAPPVPTSAPSPPEPPPPVPTPAPRVAESRPTPPPKPAPVPVPDPDPEPVADDVLPRPELRNVPLAKLVEAPGSYAGQLVTLEAVYCVGQTGERRADGRVVLPLLRFSFDPKVRPERVDLEVETRLVPRLRAAGRLLGVEDERSGAPGWDPKPATVTVRVTEPRPGKPPVPRIARLEYYVDAEPRINRHGGFSVRFTTERVSPLGVSTAEGSEDEWKRPPRLGRVYNVYNSQYKAMKRQVTDARFRALGQQINQIVAVGTQMAIQQQASTEAAARRLLGR